MFAANAQDIAINGDNLNTKHIIGRQPIFQTMHTARIFSDIAANRTGNLTRWVRGIIKPLILNSMGDAKISDTWLGDNTTILKIDIKDLVKFAKRKQNPISQGQSAA